MIAPHPGPPRVRDANALAAALAVAYAIAFAGAVAGCATERAGRSAPSSHGPRGHAHNDYLHVHPLQDALRLGFTSVEADVFLVGGELLVGHDEAMLQSHRTLEQLYLEPLCEHFTARAAAAGDSDAGPSGEPFLLLIDIKRDGAAVYRRLRTVLARYRAMLTRFVDDRIEPGPVMVVLSGDRPRTLLEADRDRLMAMDGRLEDLDGGAPVALIPLVSDAWGNSFDWDAVDPMPADQRERLAALAARARAQGRLLRFWAAPDRPLCWQTLWECGVPLLNTDRLGDFAAWAAGVAAQHPPN